MALNYYNTGTASVANGSPNVTGVGTSWLATIKADDVYEQNGITVRVLSVTDNTHLVLVKNWPGTTTSGLAYEVRFPPPSASITASLRTLLDSLTSGILTTLAGNTGANTLTIVGSTTTNPVSLLPVGSDTNIGLDLKTKGTGNLRVTLNSVVLATFTPTTLDLVANGSATADISMLNNSAGTAAKSRLLLNNGTVNLQSVMFGTGFTTSGLSIQNAGALLSNSTAGLVLGTTAAGPITLGYNNAVVGTLDATKLNLTVPVVTTNLAAPNLIINGDMAVNQRTALNSGVVTTNGSAWMVDRFACGSSGLTTQTVTNAQVTSTLSGCAFSVKTTIGGTGAAPAAGAYIVPYYKIEGYDTAQLLWGTANARPITISFRAKYSVTGTYAIAIRNGAGNRCYVASFALTANTDTLVSLSIAGDTSGTWAIDNSCGLLLSWDQGVGTTNSTTAGTWQAAGLFGLTGGTKLCATTGATAEISAVKVEVGNVATPFQPDALEVNLAKCHRYYLRKAYLAANKVLATLSAFNTSGAWGTVGCFPVVMRVAPTVGHSATTDFACWNAASSTQSNLTAITWASTNWDYGIGSCNTTAAILAAGNASVMITSSSNAVLTFDAEI